jgi:hypothetical protein
MKKKIVKIHITKIVRKQVRKLSRNCTYTFFYNLILNVFTVVILNYILDFTNTWSTTIFKGVKGQDIGGSETILRSYNKEFIR